ncbi:MAG: integration host factor subunit beta [Alloprevotella sp.]|nr:integration host factor subunit beta [Alloprevotella sp.]
MTKADLVAEISEKTGLDKTSVLITVEAFMETIKDSLQKENNVYLRGFGSFIRKRRAQKTARNITRNTTIVIPEHDIPAFKPAKSFMQLVRK